MLTGEGTSVKTFVHNSRLFSSKDETIRKFDYGKKENTIVYGQPEPPIYDYKNITSKVTIIIGSYDATCNMEAAQKFADLINASNGKKLVNVKEIKYYTHFSFCDPKVPEELYSLFDESLKA